MKLTPPVHGNLFRKIGKHARACGVELYAVGGCVRDWLLGKKTGDVDMTGGGDIRRIADYLEKKRGARVKKFPGFLTYRCELKNGLRIDIAYFRKETYPSPCALPAVSRANGLREDLVRRDFACNALCIDLSGEFGKVVDLFGSARDIERGIVRIMHSKSFEDDPTRAFRAARFCARFGWKADSFTLNALEKAVKKRIPHSLSRERIRNEFVKILKEQKAEKALSLLRDWGVLDAVYPGLPAVSLPSGTALERIAFIAAKMENGMDFARSLNLKRKDFTGVKRVMEISRSESSPLSETGAFEKKVLSLVFPEKPESAFRKLFTGGEDLKKLGFPQGPRMGRALRAAAKAQWKGEIKNKREAIKWLKKNIF